MSFPRHREIYRSDGRGWRREWARNGVVAAPGAHRFDESPAGYSLAGWSPPEPASASPAQSSMHQNGAKRYTFTVNGSLSPITLSHARGSLQIPQRLGYPMKPMSLDGKLARLGNTVFKSGSLTPNQRASVAPY